MGSPGGAAGGGDGGLYGLGQLDASAAKQMAALSAAGMARMAQSGRRGGPSTSGGSTSGALLAALSSPSPHDLQQQPRPQPQPTHAPGAMQHDPFIAIAQAMARPNPPPNVLHVYKQRLGFFLNSISSYHAGRGAPLPPALTGIPYPQGYDPQNSPWKAIEPSAEVGSFRLAGRDVDLFKLWTTVLSAGGSAKVCLCSSYLLNRRHNFCSPRSPSKGSGASCPPNSNYPTPSLIRMASSPSQTYSPSSTA